MTRASPKSAGKQRGRPAKTEVELLRVKVWYLAVKARGWTDYRLDLEFAWENDKNERKGADRLRVFETIGRRLNSPSAGRHPKRQFDLISRVDTHPEFVGTADIYASPFWRLMQADDMGLDDAHAFVVEQLERCNALRPSKNMDFLMRHADHAMRRIRPEEDFSDIELYQIALKQIVQKQPLGLDVLALLGGLFREAYLVCELEIAMAIKDLFLEALNTYTSQEWLEDVRFQLLEEAVHKILHWLVAEKVSEENSTYGEFPGAVVKRALLPHTKTVKALLPYVDELADIAWQSNFIPPEDA